MKEQLAQSWQNMIERLHNWLDLTIINLPNFVLAFIVFIGFYILSVYLKKLVRRPIGRFTQQESVKMLVMRIMSICVIAAGFILALGILNLDTVLKSILAGAGVAGLAIGLALQGTLSNTFSGVYLAVKEILNIGDWVESNGYAGIVEKITLRNTFITEPDNNQVVLPNRMVVENPFKNYGLTQQIRVNLECGISYSENLDEVRDIAIKAIRDRYPHDEEKPIEFYYTEFGDSSINFLMRFWVDAIKKLTILEARSEAIICLKAAFDENDITIPFPIRTLELNKTEKGMVRNLVSENSN